MVMEMAMAMVMTMAMEVVERVVGTNSMMVVVMVMVV